jgi:hypothetical protein
MRHTPVIFVLTLAGFALRLYYLTTTHPFFDEFTTVLAGRQILRYGWPVLPSGLFYEHGLLATYLIVPFIALFIDTPVDTWRSAQWGLMLARWPSLLVGTVTIPLVYSLGKRAFNLPVNSKLASFIALLAAGLFAFSPEGVVWGGRARMYALATLLVLLAVYWAYRGGVHPAPAKYRWLALLALLAVLLTQLGAITLIPPLVAGMLIIGWLSWLNISGSSARAPRPWFLRATIFIEGLALAAVVGGSIWVKRLGQPLGTASLTASDSGSLPEQLLYTVAYQTDLYFTWTDTVQFLSRQFGVPHHFGLTLIAVVGAVIGIIFWLANKKDRHISYFSLFLWLVFGLIIVEMVTLLDPFRRNPRYLVMYLPLFYLITAHAIFNYRHLVQLFLRVAPGNRTPQSVPRYRRLVLLAITIALLIFFTVIGFKDLRIALVTPEPAYEEAFAFVSENWQPNDALLTMNTPAADLYLGRVDGFTVQNNAGQFLLNAGTDPVDRWLGIPWIGTTAALNDVLNTHERVWFVIDTIRQPVYFQGDWLAVVNQQMEQVWANDNALVYLSRPDRVPLPARPDTITGALFGDIIRLAGYSLAEPDDSRLRLTLFWQPQAIPPTDYTVFLHLRNQNGVTDAQRDGQPLAGVYPTSRWQPGETVIDPIVLPLPENLEPGTYTLLVGLYRLDTLERLPVANDSTGENAVILGEIILP